MGLDIALGGIVLIAAYRGWAKGFVVQAIRLFAFVAAVYAAAPVRELVKPYANHYFPTIKPELADRLFWWVAAVTCYFLIVGISSLLVSVNRKQTFGMEKENRSDQFAGFTLGVVKGLIVASFTLASLEKRAEPMLDKVPWANEQVKESTAWDWNKRFHPADKIWVAPPVQQFVDYVQQMGFNGPSDTTDAEGKPVRTASRTPSLSLSPTDLPGFGPSGANGQSIDLSAAINTLTRQLDAVNNAR